jgi:hypothetical protein
MSAPDHYDEAAAAAAADSAAADYGPPLDQLFRIRPLEFGNPEHLDYRALGIGGADVEGLIRMAADDRLHDAPPDSTYLWAPVHAWRALGQLGAAEAVEPLLELLDRLEDDDWVGEELPAVFAAIGEPAVAPLRAYVADGSAYLWGRASAVSALQEIAARHAHLREGVVSGFAAHLRKAYRHDATLNGFVVAALVDLGAAEAAPEMEGAFHADLVDISIAGDWEEVQIGMGLLEERTTPAPRLYFDPPPPPEITIVPPPRTDAPKPDASKAAGKRKEARKARKRNRRR